MRARYGAGGVFARGSMASKRDDNKSRNNDSQFAARITNKDLDAHLSSSTSNASNSKVTNVALPRQSYAKELLSQCRECRAELERERAAAESDSSSSHSWTSWIPFVGSSTSDEEGSSKGEGGSVREKIDNIVGKLKPNPPPSREPPSAFTSIITSLNPFTSKEEPSDARSTADASGTTHSDHEGEAGWIGSGVWGLSAVGQKQRQADSGSRR